MTGTNSQMRGLESLRSNIGLLNPGKNISETCRQSDIRILEEKITPFL